LIEVYPLREKPVWSILYIRNNPLRTIEYHEVILVLNDQLFREGIALYQRKIYCRHCIYDRDLLRSSRYLTYPCSPVEVRIPTSPSPPRLFNEFCALRIYLSAYRAGTLMIVEDFLDSPQSLPFTGIIYIPARFALFRPHGI
jgi:hypothetical protein